MQRLGILVLAVAWLTSVGWIPAVASPAAWGKTAKPSVARPARQSTGQPAKQPSEQPAEQKLSEADRKEILNLPRMYRGAKTDEEKKKVLERAVELGPRAVARVRPVVEAGLRAELTRYQPLFQRGIAALAAKPEAKLSLELVLSSSEVLSKKRARLVVAARLADTLGPPPAPPAAGGVKPTPPASYSEQLASLERRAVEAVELARALRTLDPEERVVVEEINRQRKQRGLAPLRVDPALCRAANGHSYDMQTHNFFSHKSPLRGRTSFMDRARLAGTKASAENIAKGRTGRSVVEMWMKSDGHRRNILSGARRLGIGRTGGYYTAVFGK